MGRAVTARGRSTDARRVGDGDRPPARMAPLPSAGRRRAPGSAGDRRCRLARAARPTRVLTRMAAGVGSRGYQATALGHRAEKRLLRRLLRSPRRFSWLEGRCYEHSPSQRIRRHSGVNQDRRGRWSAEAFYSARVSRESELRRRLTPSTAAVICQRRSAAGRSARATNRLIRGPVGAARRGRKMGNRQRRAESRPGHGPGRRCAHLPERRFPAPSTSGTRSSRLVAMIGPFASSVHVEDR